MSKYTTQVRFICEAESGLNESGGFNSITEILSSAAPKIFNFQYPIFDEEYRRSLEIKILRHYYTREISEETVGLWKLRLEDRLNLIMPYYNKLYSSELITFNPMHDVNVTRDHQRDNTGENVGVAIGDVTSSDSGTRNGTTATHTDTSNTETQAGTSSDTDWDLYSDTPQGGIDFITNDGDGVADNTYLTNARKKTNDGTTTATANASGDVDTETTENISTTNIGSTQSTNRTTSNITNTEEYIEHITGKQGTTSFSKMLEEFRETFLNIDKMVIEELADLFFGLW